jgi:hypothetical protein
MVNQQNMNSRMGPIRPRSAKPPTARTTVMQANMHWSDKALIQYDIQECSACNLQRANSRAGTLLDPIEGCSRTPRSAKYFRSPMNEDAPSEKAREYPQKNHWKLLRNMGQLFVYGIKRSATGLTFQQRYRPARGAAWKVHSSDAVDQSRASRHRES